jgi:hypothetical protein
MAAIGVRPVHAGKTVAEGGHGRRRLPAVADGHLDAFRGQALDRAAQRWVHPHHPGGVGAVAHRTVRVVDLPTRLGITDRLGGRSARSKEDDADHDQPDDTENLGTDDRRQSAVSG